jgi:hypothetical protein
VLSLKISTLGDLKTYDMKKLLLFTAITAVFCSLTTVAQNTQLYPPTFVGQSAAMTKTAPISSMKAPTISETSNETFLIPNNFKANKPSNLNALPNGMDPALQTTKSLLQTRAPIVNIPGIGSNGGGAPPDPSGAVGPNHYVQMVNRQYQVWDKSGNQVTSALSLNQVLGSGSGDPIAVYDRFADRWLLSEFVAGDVNTIKVAISETPDPTGAFYLYTFQFDSFPDYFKIGVWHDGYYLTANKFSGNTTYVLERDRMLAGDQYAQIIGFDLPQNVVNGFSSPGPINAEGPELPDASNPGKIVYLQDDAWGGVSQDHIKLWNIVPNWEQTGNSTISAPQEIITEPFDSFFNAFGVGDIEQPNTTQRIDAIGGAVMYQVQYKEFEDHNSILMNHSVDVDGALQGGIRWYEFRQPNAAAPWSIYQQGTYAPDTESRFMGSIAFDGTGAIGLCYAVSGPNTFPSVRYTGRFPNDPLGEMTITEETVINGTNSQTTFNRFGDYSQLTIDPNDDLTFWFTGEYFGGGLWRTRVTSFILTEEFNNDVGIVSIDAPANGDLSASEAITVTVRNYGDDVQTGFPVTYQVDGGGVITETFTGTLNGGAEAQFTFAQAADFSGNGVDYDVILSTALGTDEANFNDAINPTVKSLLLNDVGVTTVVGPRNDDNQGAEDVEVLLYNFGATDQSNFNVTYTLDGGAAVTEQFTGTLASESSVPFTFSAQADLSVVGPHDLVISTALSGDEDASNNSMTVRVISQDCIPRSTGSTPNNGCASDGLKNFELGTIKNISGCGNDGNGVGYSDFTFISTDLDVSVGTYDLTVRSGFAPEEVAVWIDFNDNGVFETSENVFTGQITTANVDQTFSLDLPASAAIGTHTMRAKAIDAGGSGTGIDDPCGDVQWGETEDYTVNIVDQTVGVGDFNIADSQFRVITLDNNAFQVHLDTAFQFDQTPSIQVYNVVGQTVTAVAVDFEGSGYRADLNLGNQSAGIYLVSISNNQFTKTKKVIVK